MSLFGPTAPAPVSPFAPQPTMQGRVLGALNAGFQRPAGALTGLVPSPVQAILGTGTAPLPQIDLYYQRNLTSLNNKYTNPEIAPIIASLSPEIRNALIQFDTERVARGTSPLTERQTLLAARAAQEDVEATPAPDRNPLNVLGNFKSDLSDLIRSVPRLPLALFNEVTELPQIGSQIAQAQAQGANPIQAIAQAPGVRLIPGAYTVGELSRGTEGIRELASHPLMTALDLLPAASKIAEGTPVARAAAEQGVTGSFVGNRPRPITANLMYRLDEAGNLQRSRLGVLADIARNDSRPGQLLDAAFGARTRETMRAKGRIEQRFKALGIPDSGAVPETALEDLYRRSTTIDKDYAEVHPQLLDDTPDGAAWRAQAAEDFARGRNLDNYDPGFVAAYRELSDEIGRQAAEQGVIGAFRNEMYPTHVADTLRSRESNVLNKQRIMAMKPEYMNPSGNLTLAQIRQFADDVMADPNMTTRAQSARALQAVLDAYGFDPAPLKSALAAARRSSANWSDVRLTLDEMLDGTVTPRARRTMTDIVEELRKYRSDAMVFRLDDALAAGRIGEVTKALRNLMARKPPKFPEAEWPQFVEDVRSASRRADFESKIGKRANDKTLAQSQATLDRYIDKHPPARFDALLRDQANSGIRDAAIAERGAVNVTAEEAGRLASAIQEGRWEAVFPDMDPELRTATVRQIENEVAATWRTLVEQGHDPVFVHKVSPGRAASVQSGNIDPVPRALSQGKERALDATASVNDLAISLKHQAGELLQDRYRAQFLDEVIESVGRTEEALRSELADVARARAATNPALNFEGHLQQAISRGWEKLNVEELGHAWGGVRLDKYSQDSVYVPKAIAENLHRITQPPLLITQAISPITDVFRLNVIGLSPSVIINNMFGNIMAASVEQGPSVLKSRYFKTAQEWWKDPSKIPDPELRGMLLQENPNHFDLSRKEWMKSHGGQRFLEGLAAGNVFRDSAAAEAIKRGKSALEGIAEKSYRAQQWGDSMIRSMTYLDEFEKQIKRGVDDPTARQRALESVRRTIVDYGSFTQIERQAIRSVVPFYSFMSHASRFVARYPLDHPLRTAIAMQLAAAEKERLGALPGSFLGMLPIGGTDENGNRTMLSMRPFDAFGDVDNLLSFSGWLAAMNPLISTALEQSGMVRGSVDSYPTLRYDAETGRLVPVHGGVLSNLADNIVPRAGALMSLAGLNDSFNKLSERDPAAAARSLAGQFGIPRLWQNYNLPQERMRAELNRQRVEGEVRNDALRSGDWNEALRYPNLQQYYDVIAAAEAQNPDTFAEFQPATQEALEAQIRALYAGAN